MLQILKISVIMVKSYSFTRLLAPKKIMQIISSFIYIIRSWQSKFNSQTNLAARTRSCRLLDWLGVAIVDYVLVRIPKDYQRANLI